MKKFNLLNLNELICFLKKKYYNYIFKLQRRFTGLFDENGKEIKEGDIVKWYHVSMTPWGESESYWYGVINWYPGGYTLETIKTKSNEEEYSYPLQDIATDTESDVIVLGNIKNNPEIIKQIKENNLDAPLNDIG